MASLAKAFPEELDAMLEAETLSDSRWMSSLLLRAWSANPESFAERIVRFVLDNPAQRLNMGYDLSVGITDTFVAVSRTAVAAASARCCEESFAALENSILSFTPDWEQGNEFEGRTRLALLRALAQDRSGEVARDDIRRLEEQFPEAGERGAPEPPERRVMAEHVGSPILAEAGEGMSNDQWLSAMQEYATDTTTFREGKYVGGVIELSRELEMLVRKDTSRFTALVNQMDETYSAHYFDLRGLTSGEEGLGLERLSRSLRFCVASRSLVFQFEAERSRELSGRWLRRLYQTMPCGCCAELRKTPIPK